MAFRCRPFVIAVAAPLYNTNVSTKFEPRGRVMRRKWVVICDPLSFNSFLFTSGRGYLAKADIYFPLFILHEYQA
jgi:hypothetical protein